MTQEEIRAAQKKPVDVVCIRSFKSKKNADSKSEDFEVGQEITMTRQFGDEALSLGKVVKKGSDAHKKWIADEEKRKKSKAAKATPSLQESIATLVDSIAELVEALKPKK